MIKRKPFYLNSYQFYHSDLKEFNSKTFNDFSRSDSETIQFQLTRSDSKDFDQVQNHSEKLKDYSEDFEQVKIEKPFQRIELIATFSKSFLLTTLILDDVDVSRLHSMRSMCKYCVNLKTVSLKNWHVPALINCDYCFSECENLEVIEIEWLEINPKINCYRSLFKCPAAVLSNSDFKFNCNFSLPIPLY